MASWNPEGTNEWSADIKGIVFTITEKPPRKSDPPGPRYILDSPDECVGEYKSRDAAEKAAEAYAHHGGKTPKHVV